VKRALKIARGFRSKLTRHERYGILMRAGALIAARREDLARLITLESGLCLKDSRYEVGRASDVLLFAANQALVDSARCFPAISPRTARAARSTPCASRCSGAITAITPFNHPLNQVIHKVAPALPPTTAWCSNPAKRRR
jgi:acyl-CoA reductase-like NAD-dependent aldehyde dehydrogenase